MMDALQPSSIKVAFIDRAQYAQGQAPRVETYVRRPATTQTASQDFTRPQNSQQTINLFQARLDDNSGLSASTQLSDEEQAITVDLKARDREVRAHEQAHANVGGAHAGSPSYGYQTGPDGKQYAVSGEVPIDASPVPNDPEATIQKMDIVKAAALAPTEPSSQDRKVAAMADSQRNQALADLAELRNAVNEPKLIERQLDIAA